VEIIILAAGRKETESPNLADKANVHQ
jgi:hypothetical protein